MHHLVKRILTYLKSRFGALTLGPIIAAVLLTLLLAANVAADTSTATYYACVSHNGTIRMITANGMCNGNDTKISWNQEGPAGPQGPQGPAGGNQHLSAVYADSPNVTIPPNGVGTAEADCPSGGIAIYGTYVIIGGGAGAILAGQGPLANAQGWQIALQNISSTDQAFLVTATCIILS